MKPAFKIKSRSYIISETNNSEKGERETPILKVWFNCFDTTPNEKFVKELYWVSVV